MHTEAVNRRGRMPPEVASRILRLRYFYSIENAGLKLGLSRTQAYAQRGRESSPPSATASCCWSGGRSGTAS